MRVADLMQMKVITVLADDTIADAIVTLAEAHVSGVPVVDRRHRLLGVLSTTDILTALSERGVQGGSTEFLEETPVRDLMTPRPLVISPEAQAREAAQHMLFLGVHRLFVEEAGSLVGVISQTDIVRAVATAPCV